MMIWVILIIRENFNFESQQSKKKQIGNTLIEIRLMTFKIKTFSDYYYNPHHHRISFGFLNKTIIYFCLGIIEKRIY